MILYTILSRSKQIRCVRGANFEPNPILSVNITIARFQFDNTTRTKLMIHLSPNINGFADANDNKLECIARDSVILVIARYILLINQERSGGYNYRFVRVDKIYRVPACNSGIISGTRVNPIGPA